ncbi:MAG: hypothetical protein R2712_02000 [Vicinamibacterales bacterium]
MMLWDRGTRTPESPDVDAALRKGDLKFTLEGKLKGSWALVRTRGYGGGTSWLLIKHRDEWAGPIDIATFAPLSVKTPDADFADILASDTPALWTSEPAEDGRHRKLFQRIRQALEMKEAPAASSAARPKARGRRRPGPARRPGGVCPARTAKKATQRSGSAARRQGAPIVNACSAIAVNSVSEPGSARAPTSACRRREVPAGTCEAAG